MQEDIKAKGDVEFIHPGPKSPLPLPAHAAYQGAEFPFFLPLSIKAGWLSGEGSILLTRVERYSAKI